MVVPGNHRAVPAITWAEHCVGGTYAAQAHLVSRQSGQASDYLSYWAPMLGSYRCLIFDAHQLPVQSCLEYGSQPMCEPSG